jgi:hypothetical protein
MVLFEEIAWNSLFLSCLSPSALGDWSESYLRRKVQSNDSVQAWLYRTNSTLVTENCYPNFFLWCFEGSDAVGLWCDLARTLQPLGFLTIECVTMHRGIIRAFRRFSPRITPTDIPGELRVIIDIPELIAHESESSFGRPSHDAQSIDPQRRRSAKPDFGVYPI